MRRLALTLAFFAVPTLPALAESVVAARLIRSQTVIAAEDVMLRDEEMPGAQADLAEALGKEVRVNIYAGRPVRAADLASPALIERNQVVTLNYSHGGLSIATDAAKSGDRRAYLRAWHSACLKLTA